MTDATKAVPDMPVVAWASVHPSGYAGQFTTLDFKAAHWRSNGGDVRELTWRDDATARLSAMAAEVEGLRKDAERFWQVMRMSLREIEALSRSIYSDNGPESFEAAIDAAIAARSSAKDST